MHNGKMIDDLMGLVDKYVVQTEEAKTTVRHAFEFAYFDGRFEATCDFVGERTAEEQDKLDKNNVIAMKGLDAWHESRGDC